MPFSKIRGNEFCKFHAGDFDIIPWTEVASLYITAVIICIVIIIIINISNYSMWSKETTIFYTDTHTHTQSLMYLQLQVLVNPNST